MYIILSDTWTTPINVGQCMPPTSSFVIENINKTRAVIYGGAVNEGYTANNVYIIDITKTTVVS